METAKGSKAKANIKIRRPFHALASLGTVAHHAFELAAGVGLVFQPELGLGGSAALWGLGLPAWFAIAARGTSRWDRALATAAGLSIAGAGIHFLIWPWKLRRGIPILTEAEGLKREYLSAYNALLYLWALAGLIAIIRETPRGERRWALALLPAIPGGMVSARYHFKWVREQARTNPAWWNRGVTS